MRLLMLLENIFDRILGFFFTIAGILLSLVTLSVCLEVILRYIFNRPQVWVIELSEYALLYITFLGAAWVLKDDGHVKVDLFIGRLSPKGRAICSFSSFVAILLISIVLCICGIRVTWDHYIKGIYNPTILEIPKSMILLIIPLGGITLFIQSIRGAVQSLKSILENR